jgi:hypothetical protein
MRLLRTRRHAPPYRALVALLALLAGLWCGPASAAGPFFPGFGPNGGLADVGVPSTSRPYVILLAGQSNAVGRDHLGSKAVQPGIYILNSFMGGTLVVPAAFGTAPLNLATGGSSTTTDPATADNNQGVQFANALRLSGMIPASRPIVIIPNAQGGQSIAQWIGLGTSSPYWTSLLSSLAAVNAVYPGFTIDHVIWDQGEADSTSGGTTTYASQTAYSAAFSALLAQWRTLPQWTPTSTVSVTELAPFYDNPQQDRNDALRTMRGGLFDPYVDFVSGAGLTESADSPLYHYDGNSLVTLGQRHFSAWVDSRISGRYFDHGAISSQTGGAHTIPDQITASGTTNISPDMLRSGRLLINGSGTINLPPVSYAGAVEIVMWATGNVTLSSASAIAQEGGASVSPVSLNLPTGTTVALWRIVGNPITNRWVVESFYPRTGNTVFNAPAVLASGSVTLNANATRFGQFQLSNTSVQLPATATEGSLMVFFNLGGGASTLTATGVTSGVLDKVYNPAQVPVTTYTMPPSTMLMLLCIRQKWFVLYESASMARAAQVVTLTSGGTTTLTTGLGVLSVLIANTATVASQTFALPSNPVDGQQASLQTKAGGGVSAVAWSNGTVDTTVPTAFAAASRYVLTYSTANGSWF